MTEGHLQEHLSERHLLEGHASERHMPGGGLLKVTASEVNGKDKCRRNGWHIPDRQWPVF